MVSVKGNIRKEKSRNLTNFHRIKKGLKKKNAFEFSTLVVGVDACTTRRDHECGGVVRTTTNGVVVVGGLKKKKKRNIRDLIQNHLAEIGITSSSSEQDDDVWSVVQERALIQAIKELIPKGKDVVITNQWRWEQVATSVPGKKKKTANQCRNKFASLVKKGFSFN